MYNIAIIEFIEYLPYLYIHIYTVIHNIKTLNKISEQYIFLNIIFSMIKLQWALQKSIKENTAMSLRMPQGPCLSIKTIFPGMGGFHKKKRRLLDHLIFVMGSPIVERWHLYIDGLMQERRNSFPGQSPQSVGQSSGTFLSSMQRNLVMMYKTFVLTPSGLVKTYSNTELSQHWLR